MTGDPAPPAAAALRGVEVDFETPGGVVHAVRGVDHEFARGTATAIVGRSGSGKSSLVAVMSLLRRPTRGDVLIDGRSSASMSDPSLAALRGTAIGTVFQRFHLDDDSSAAENVMMPWYFGGRSSRREALATATECLGRLGIAELAQRRTAAMSGGQRQRVAIARALFRDPLLLVADEPTGNLDEETANLVVSDLFSLPQRFGTTLVIVTHDADIAARADHVLHLTHGRVEHATVA